MRQIAGAFAQYEKARLVARLKRAPEVKGKLGGRKDHAELRPNVVALAKGMRRKNRKGGGLSLRGISAALAKKGHLSFNGQAVQRDERPQHASAIEIGLGAYS